VPYTDTGRKNTAIGGGVGSVNVTLNSTVAGNLVVVGASTFNGSSIDPNSIVTDGVNAWTQTFSRVASSGANRQEAALSFSVLTTGGNLTITVDPGTAIYDMWVDAHEFSGPHATPSSGTPVTNEGTTETTSDTTAFTPADSSCLFVAVDGNSASGTITENVAPGNTDWTLSNENESGAGAEPGERRVLHSVRGAFVAPRRVDNPDRHVLDGRHRRLQACHRRAARHPEQRIGSAASLPAQAA
jgi:hypothetical protein